MKRGRLGKAKKNQYMSDKKAQILDGSSVWVWSEAAAAEFYSSLPILKDLWNFLCIQSMAKAKAKWRNFLSFIVERNLIENFP